MGSGLWNSQVYYTVAAIDYETKSREEIFIQRGLHADMDLK